MSGFLPDTNVISELTRQRHDPQVIRFLSEQSDLWLSVIVIHELHFGIQIMPNGQRRERQMSANQAFITRFRGRILPVDATVSEWAARFRSQAQHSGKTLHLGDAIVAGTAKAHDLIVATRDADFDGLDVETVNPWESP